ncbi:TlpA disulfide reductase family protein [Nocardia callitridis]|uniref:TlpA disulfide reductase family protein n=1 Tax=Nocardia callitridis TaxID=648753 RepID=A0ABP9K1U9_9NOCA
MVAVIVVVGLTVALWPRAEHTENTRDRAAPPNAGVSEQARAAAELAPCPRAEPGATSAGPLAGITVKCLADGRSTDIAAALGGKPALLNLWAYWCAPCAEELPYLRQYAQRAGNAITVLTVHSDPDEAKALARLTDMGIRVPGVLDAEAAVRNAVGAPAVLPVSVLLRADGSVARVMVRAFTGVDDIAATVANELGVAA